MSESWIKGNGRLRSAVGIKKEAEIIREVKYELKSVLSKIDEQGNVTLFSLDSNAQKIGKFK